MASHECREFTLTRKSTRNVSFRDLEIPWGWDFSWDFPLLKDARWRGRGEKSRSKTRIWSLVQKKLQREKKNTGRGQKKVGAGKSGGGWERQERDILAAALQTVLLSLCHTEFVLQQFQGCDQVEKKYKTITRTPNQAVKEWGKAAELKMMLRMWSAVETEITELSAHTNSQSCWEVWKRGGE